MVRWQYTSIDVYPELDVASSGLDRLDKLCLEGWEPYAVTLSEHYRDRHTTDVIHVHHLKRRLESE